MKRHTLTVICERRTYRVRFHDQQPTHVWLVVDETRADGIDLASPLGRMVADLARARLAMEARGRRSRAGQAQH